MAEEEKKDLTTEKRSEPHPPFTGVEGKKFSSENQPTPEAKKAGWKQIREQRHLTQEIIKMMIGEDGKPTQTFKEYMAALVSNAKTGNPKAIDAINKCIEDEVTKIEQTIAITPITGMEIH